MAQFFLAAITIVLTVIIVTGNPVHLQDNPLVTDATLPTLEYPGSLDKVTFFNSNHGTYFFQYDTGNSEPASFRGESRDSRGVVTGFYGYIDPDGVLRITNYRADEKGFKSSTTLRYLQLGTNNT